MLLMHFKDQKDCIAHLCFLRSYSQACDGANTKGAGHPWRYGVWSCGLYCDFTIGTKESRKQPQQVSNNLKTY